MPNFDEMFKTATSLAPYPYQQELAAADPFPQLLNVPTGLGKTAAVVLAWLWRRRFANEAIRRQTPRRLVYCLPMRTLVEQTQEVAQGFLKKLELDDKVAVHLLMGGADAGEWDEHPERDAILIGTQDMLLSRALNRGYGMSRYRWPVHFGLLNNDSLWVMDETQLMGVGLTTTAQLQGLRASLDSYGATHSLWMSATLDTSHIGTVDHPEPADGFSRLGLTDEDRKHDQVARRLNSKKILERSPLVLTAESEKKGYAKELAAAIHEAHRPGTLTLAILNRVSRAQDVYADLGKLLKKADAPPETALIHARFRPGDRKRHEERLFFDTVPESGRIVITSPAIEAGVDVSAATMFTELAPWPSLVQRFGRCNRGGEFSDARVVWIDAQPKDAKDKVCPPYAKEELDGSRAHLETLKDAGPASLANVCDERPAPVAHTLRRKDLLDLWDTTPDLAGNDLDVSRFIRDAEDTDVQVYWRELPNGQPPNDFPAPSRGELCSVAVGQARDFLGKLAKKQLKGFVWQPLEKDWRQIAANEVRPGMTLLLTPEMGGYLDELGWTGEPKHSPQPCPPESAHPNESYGDDRLGTEPITLAQHLSDVADESEALRQAMNGSDEKIPWKRISTAARWHDVGKAHEAFQTAMRDSDAVRQRDPDARQLWAKSGTRDFPNYRMEDGAPRRGFRHELASALAWLALRGDQPDADLIAYLIAAHHGKVRASIRSMPNEKPPADDDRLFARGVWDGDQLPVALDGGEVSVTSLDLSLMQLGEGATGPSWLARVLALRDEYGPFRLSYLETLLRVADWRRS